MLESVTTAVGGRPQSARDHREQKPGKSQDRKCHSVVVESRSANQSDTRGSRFFLGNLPKLPSIDHLARKSGERDASSRVANGTLTGTPRDMRVFYSFICVAPPPKQVGRFVKKSWARSEGRYCKPRGSPPRRRSRGTERPRRAKPLPVNGIRSSATRMSPARGSGRPRT